VNFSKSDFTVNNCRALG